MPDAPAKGLKQSPLRLNTGLGQLETWNEAAIQSRAGKLADQALAVWVAPKLDAATLATGGGPKKPDSVLSSDSDHSWRI
jgi:hypothetical protein